ncbi:MAG: hypothetical protein GY926_11475 [bacterium]|nr:hypothetical protein [bacterium]MCP4965847.1 hypothetical protein [bacterium]
MAFHVRTRQGEFISNPNDDTIDRVLAELDDPLDPEHPDVSLGHESGWTLSVFPSGLLLWENVESDDGPRQRARIDRREIRRLWLALAKGDLASVEGFGWNPGNS